MPKTYHKHGLRHHPLYFVFREMKYRCEKSTHPAYKNYGGRGIRCEWLSFEDFFADMGKTWQKGLTVERINNDGNYSKSNCRWATRQEQVNNTRRNVILEFNGIKQTLQQWAEQVGVSHWTLRMRLKRGMSIERALSRNDLRA